ncbi:MAG: hypothetical protein RSE41_10170 [Clostridia bacterium]
MCEFKSGIIFKNRIIIAEGVNDSHSDLLESLGIEDNYLNASKTFVRAELIPINDEWWTNPIDWKFIVDQDIVPEWFEIDKWKYEKLFRDAVIVWWEEHVLVNQKINKLSDGYYRLKGCEVGSLRNNVIVLLDNSIVYNMYDYSTVQLMIGNSTVKKMFNNSIIQRMLDNSIVPRMFNNSIIQAMYDNSIVKAMYNNSTVQGMYCNSAVQGMWNYSTILGMYNNSIVRSMYDNSIARDFKNSPINKIIIPNEKNEFVIIKHINN